jgi:class 3 adenylate cyclase
MSVPSGSIPGGSIPGGTVTFAFTDIEGSTRLLQELGDEYGEIVSAHRRIIRETFGERGGTEMDTQGDAFFFSFARARAAVEAAVAAQRALGDHAWPRGKEVRVRMGLHTGEPSVGDEGYIGLDVVRAARICSAGHGRQILISETTRALLGNQLPEGVSVHDLGEAHLKDIQHEHVYQLSIDGGPSEFPPLKTAPEPETESWGAALSKQIQEEVRRDIERSFRGEKRRGESTREVAGELVQLVLVAVAVIVIVLIVKLVFF